MEGTCVDEERFDGLARSVAEREEERTRDREQFETLTRLVSAKGSRRAALAGLVAIILQGQVPEPSEAGCRGKKGKRKRQCRRRIGAGACQEKLFGLCTINPFDISNNPCCNGMACIGTIDPIVTACQFRCTTDDDCKKKFPGKALACRTDVLVCPFEALVNQKCCVPL
jgi:hypothetical protein